MRLLRKVIPLLGVLLLLYVIKKTGFVNILNKLTEGNYVLIMFALLLFVPMTLLQTIKWNFILKKQNINLNFLYLLKVQVISLFYEFVTPARIGSFIKIAYLQEKLKNFGKSASSVVIDRFLDFLIVAFLAFIGSLILLNNKATIFYASITVFVLFLLGFLVLTNRKLSRILWNFAYKIVIPKKLKERAMNSFNEFYKVLPKPEKIIILSILTFVFWLLVYTQAYLFALAFNVKIPYLEFIFLFPISVIISLIPITVSGFGTREATLLVIFSKFNIDRSGIVTFSIVWMTMSIIIYSIIALYLLLRKKI